MPNPALQSKHEKPDSEKLSEKEYHRAACEGSKQNEETRPKLPQSANKKWGNY